MRIALDTNRYVDLARGVPEVAAKVGTADAVFLPFVVLGELRSGFLGGSRYDSQQSAWTAAAVVSGPHSSTASNRTVYSHCGCSPSARALVSGKTCEPCTVTIVPCLPRQ